MSGTTPGGASETSETRKMAEREGSTVDEERKVAVKVRGRGGVGSRSSSGRRSDLNNKDAGVGLVCEWDDCTELLPDVHLLAEHLLHAHIRLHTRPGYVCLWNACPRKGLAQTSRFALIAHCRSHTGEKPFVCTVPDCDKSFTRSDTLAKHLRHQHNLAAPTTTRGGYRKRKRASPTPPLPASSSQDPSPASPLAAGAAATTTTAPGRAPSHYNFANRAYAHARDAGFNTFRVNPPTHQQLPPPPPLPPPQHYPTAGYHHYQQQPPYHHESSSREEEEDTLSLSSAEEENSHPWDPEKYGGRSKAMVKYIIMKAKHRFALDENKLLIDQLESLKRQESEEWKEKEAGVDRIFRGMGPESDRYVHSAQPHPPPSSSPPPHDLPVSHRTTPPPPTNGNGSLLPRRGRSSSRRSQPGGRDRRGPDVELDDREDRERRQQHAPEAPPPRYVSPTRRMSLDESTAERALSLPYDDRDRDRYEYPNERDRERTYERYEGHPPPPPPPHMYPSRSAHSPYNSRAPGPPHSPSTSYHPPNHAASPVAAHQHSPLASPQQHRATVDSNIRNGMLPPLEQLQHQHQSPPPPPPMRSPQALLMDSAGVGGTGPGWSHERGRAPPGALMEES